MLNFFGRGYAFDENQNSAFFTDDDDIILIDCPMSAFHKLKNMNIEKLTVSNNIHIIYILVTHTHGDHVSGIATLIQYAYYVWHIPVVVAAPSEEVKEDLRFLIERLEGCDKNAFHLTTASSLHQWVIDIIPTTHVPGLAGRCFGYHLLIDDADVIYTGDTNTLQPYKNYITQIISKDSSGSDTYLYTEAAAYKSPVHIYLPDEVGYLTSLTENGVNVYLMHIDDENTISSIIEGTPIKLAPLYK